ncbi:MAG: Unknown protein [uncultured Sulfurovum sp.]|uniref:Lipoprotein n=1 Tax=uncultured Sulfurovum sp. TaxID=269237 RepID=A0A6S6RWN2_9BACT|nr:MAG: Unknown protein [uncultured Sulfurovum sp.]
MKNMMFVSYAFGISFILSACGSVETPVHVEKNIGYFVSDFNTNIDYACGSERKHMNESGKFECDSFPISFYMDQMKIGQISSIHNDGYVYPQDIIVIEDKAPIYTSEGNMSFLVIE